MAWLSIDNKVTQIDANSIGLTGNIPAAVYRTVYSKQQGTYLAKSEIRTSHGKVYGNSQKNADHIVAAYRSAGMRGNMGVLLSGGRGLGKTLTTRLVIEQLMPGHPVVLVSEYTPDLPAFLANLSGCVVLMDEFDKFMSGNADNSDAVEVLTKQESILSVLDGNTAATGNLFLFTCNRVDRVDKNMLSRPGRIRYHYRYESETADVIREYCEDNLERKELIPRVVKVLGLAPIVSLDILAAFVEELNIFADSTPEEVIHYLNIDTSDTRMTVYITVEANGKKATYMRKISEPRLEYDAINLIPADAERYSFGEPIPDHMFVTVKPDRFPRVVYDRADFDPNDIILSEDCVNVVSAFVVNDDYVHRLSRISLAV